MDASSRNGTAVRADLGKFVSEVKMLKTSGQLSSASATELERRARATRAQATRQLHTASKAQAAAASDTREGRSPTSTSPAADPTTATAPVSSSPSIQSSADPGAKATKATKPAPPATKPRPLDTKPAPPAGKQTQNACNSRWPGHRHHDQKRGHRGFGNTECRDNGDPGWSSRAGGWTGGGGD